MVGSTGTLMSMRLVRSKLRKREESSAASPTALESPHQTNYGNTNRSSSAPTTCDREHQDQQIFVSASLNECSNHHAANNKNSSSIDSTDQREQISFTRTSGIGVNTANNGWVFPPKAPTPNIYNCMNNDTFAVGTDRNGFKGFRKQFSGRFKRLVSKKAEPTSPIPPELKPQLKTIYVY